MEKYDVIIIGAGPGGLNCALYAARGGLKVIFIEKGAPGGKMTSTFKIENWIGDEEVKGFELSQRMLTHAKKMGAIHKFGLVEKIKTNNEFDHEVNLANGETLKGKSIVIATGMENLKPNIEKIDEFENRGVSYCVICDGPFYKDKPAAIIGGGNSAFEEAIYLSSIASEVNIFVRDEVAIAEKMIVQKVDENKKINVFYKSSVSKLIGDNGLEAIEFVQDGQTHTKEIKHLYPYIGFKPLTSFAKDLDITDAKGFVITNESMETKVAGVYAIGDVRQKQIRQIITAASDGAIVGKILANKLTNN